MNNCCKDKAIKHDDKHIKIGFSEHNNFNVSMKDCHKMKVNANEMIINEVVREVDYVNDVINKPKINNVTLIHNKTSEELGLEPTIIDITEQDIDKIIYGG